jgi:hypothetical protein
MRKKEDFWYRVGYTLESARGRIPRSGQGKLPTLPLKAEASRKVLDAVLTVGAGSILARVLSIWPGRTRPGVLRLFRAGVAGAAAGFLSELIRPALVGAKPEVPLEEELADVLLSGAGRGLLYAAVVEPRIPGPALVQGSAYGALEFALTPWGGLEELTGSAAPHQRIPVLSVLLHRRAQEELFLEHLVFGVALALLYDH